MKIDLEFVLNKFIVSVKEKINPAILAMNTEKNDSIVLKTIDDKAYAFQTMSEKVMNYNPFIYYGLLECPTKAEFMAIAKSPKIELTIVIADPEDGNTAIRLLRYQRVFEEMFLDQMFPIKGINTRVKIENLEPVSFKSVNSDTHFKAIGVIIELDLFS